MPQKQKVSCLPIKKKKQLKPNCQPKCCHDHLFQKVRRCHGCRCCFPARKSTFWIQAKIFSFFCISSLRLLLLFFLNSLNSCTLSQLVSRTNSCSMSWTAVAQSVFVSMAPTDEWWDCEFVRWIILKIDPDLKETRGNKKIHRTEMCSVTASEVNKHAKLVLVIKIHYFDRKNLPGVN